jgi:hypothetical protein
LTWIGLIADDIVVSPRLRRFIDEYLFSFMMMPADQQHIAMPIRQAYAMSLVREAHPDAISNSQHDHDTEQSMVGKSIQMQRLRNLQCRYHQSAGTQPQRGRHRINGADAGCGGLFDRNQVPVFLLNG